MLSAGLPSGSVLLGGGSSKARAPIVGIEEEEEEEERGVRGRGMFSSSEEVR